MRRLCRLDSMPDGSSRGFGPSPGGFTGLFAVRQGCAAQVYVNACPHIGAALDWTPDDFLTADRTSIVCFTHGALFAIDTGLCIKGPCKGDKLEHVAALIEDGWILVPDDAGL